MVVRTVEETSTCAAPLNLVVSPDTPVVNSAMASCTANGVFEHKSVLVDLQTGSPADNSNTSRPPVDLCLVLDFSGSMSGQKEANLKHAVKCVLDSLNDEDNVHIVAYSNKPRVITTNVKAGKREDIINLVNAERSFGGTNISAALEMARSLLVARQVASGVSHSTTSHVRRIFLYSDGQPNQGVVHVEEMETLCSDINEQGIDVWSFGIGEDINSDLMQNIAQGGGGQYNFVTIRRIQELTDRAIMSMQKLLGMRTELIAEFTCGNAEITHVGSHEVTEQERTSPHRVFLGDIRYNNLRQVLLQLKVNQLEARDSQPQCTLQLTVEFMLADTPLAPVQRVTNTITFTPLPAGELPPVSDRKVSCAVAMANISTVFAQATALIESNDSNTAKTLIEEALSDLAQYEEDDETGFVSTQLRRGRRTLDRLLCNSGSRRVVHELMHQSNMADRLSACDMMSSESDNITPPGSPGANAAPPFPGRWTSRQRFGSSSWSSGSGSSGSPDDLDDDTTDDDSDMDLIVPPPPAIIIPPQQKQQDTSSSAAPPPLVLHPLLVAEPDAHCPKEFFCPLTKQPMTDPVITMDGHTYERSAIQTWFDKGNKTSPLTNLALPAATLFPNFALRDVISAWEPASA